MTQDPQETFTLLEQQLGTKQGKILLVQTLDPMSPGEPALAVDESRGLLN